MTTDIKAEAAADKGHARVMKKCPKCGKLNEADAIFCEECDWKLNMKFTGKGSANYLMNAWMFASGSFLCGLIAIICAFTGLAIVSVVFGAVGMFLGGYVQSFVKVVNLEGDNRKYTVILGICGLLISVVGFIYAFAHLF